MKQNKLLIISAHADDNLACAGTVFKLSQNSGFSAFEIILTNSGLGQDFKSKRELKEALVAKTRAKELSRAAKFLGLKKSFQFNQPDLGLISGREIVFKTAEIIREIKPKIVFLHNNYDGHPDHKAAFEIGLNAIKVAAMGVKKESLGQPWRAPLVLCAEGMLPIKAQILVDITEFMVKKLKLFRLYSSQASPQAIAFEKALATIRGYHLKKGNSFFAEAFSLQKEFPILFFEKNEPKLL